MLFLFLVRFPPLHLPRGKPAGQTGLDERRAGHWRQVCTENTLISYAQMSNSQMHQMPKPQMSNTQLS